MKRHFFILFALIIALAYSATVFAQKPIFVNGNFKGDLKGHNKLYFYGHSMEKDSTVVNSQGYFRFALPSGMSDMIALYDEYTLKEKGYTGTVQLLIDGDSSINIRDIDVNQGLSSGVMSGMISAVEYKSFSAKQNEADKIIELQMEKTFGPPKTVIIGGQTYIVTNPDGEPPAYKTEKDSLESAQYKLLVTRFVKDHPDSFSSVYILSTFGTKFNAADIMSIYHLLSEKRQQSGKGKSIISYAAGKQSSLPGSKVKDFVLNDAEDHPFAFSQLKGKYVIVDFWASWCGPCKASFAHMKEMYKKYKSDKFEIYSISIDKVKTSWLKDLNKQELPWLQSIDMKNNVANDFGVDAVPTTYLINPDGEIVMKSVGFDINGPLDIKLAELFGSK